VGNVLIQVSMSLDGYIAGPNDNPEQWAGEGGMSLHTWAFGDPSLFERINGRTVEETGAVIMGRRMYDATIAQMGGKGPLGEVPCFVLTHSPPASADPVFTFVPDGIESALAKAHEVAGDKKIALMGAEVNQQYLAAALVDEIRIHLVNVLLGGGRRLFDQLPRQFELERIGITENHGATSLDYHVRR
jgi:dihydrofolate reductase